jgi:TolA-binding protein
VTAEPPAHIPYFGSWDDLEKIYAVSAGRRVTMKADQLQGVFMPNPKDVRIAQLEAQLKQLQGRIADHAP